MNEAHCSSLKYCAAQNRSSRPALVRVDVWWNDPVRASATRERRDAFHFHDGMIGTKKCFYTGHWNIYRRERIQDIFYNSECLEFRLLHWACQYFSALNMRTKVVTCHKGCAYVALRALGLQPKHYDHWQKWLTQTLKSVLLGAKGQFLPDEELYKQGMDKDLVWSYLIFF